MKKEDLLLVIDMQNVYKKGGKWACLNTEGVADKINKIIDSGMQNVIFTRFIANEKNPIGVWANYNKKYQEVNHNQHANLMVDELKEQIKKYPLYTKEFYSSLTIPEVLQAAKKAKRVVITGVIAECCVLSTVFELIDQGIYTIYLTDGVSGLDRPKEEATELILSGLSPLHLQMMTVEEYINEK